MTGVWKRALPACAALATAAAGVLGACTEGQLTSVEDEDKPGQAAETREITLPADSFALWKDTTYVGFVTRNTFGPELAARDSGEFRSRALYAHGLLPETVTLDEEELEVDSVASIFFVLRPDTVKSSFSADSATVTVHSLARDFDAEQASWTQARDGEPWASPGGDLEARLAEARVMVRADTVELTVDLPADSLARAWREAEETPPVAISVSDPGFRLWLNTVGLEMLARPVDRDTLVRGFADKLEDTFIHDPELPETGTALRLGGVPAARFYLAFRPPDSARGLPIKGSVVNRAELLFHPLDAPAEPFTPRESIQLQSFRLLGDPFEFGPKTPIGSGLAGAGLRTFTLDSLESGRALRFNVTSVLASWASASSDSALSIWIGVSGAPDPQLLGFYRFGSIESPALARPELRMVITPPTPFDLP